MPPLNKYFVTFTEVFFPPVTLYLMKKYLLPLSGALLWASYSAAAVISPEAALQRIPDREMPLATRSVQLNLCHTTLTPEGNPAVYVFDNQTGDGYIFVSADDVALPLIGYASAGKFDAETMPPQMGWWLSEYARMIEAASRKAAPAYDVANSTRAGQQAVAPLLKTTWDQNSPYNMYTPSIDGTKTPTGCVATAMAQIMKFWNYPDTGAGSSTITLPGSQGTATMNFASTSFKWNDMLNSYAGSYTQTQAQAVATLMKACGYAVKMKYTKESSGAAAINAAYALIHNFKYNANLQYWQRSYIPATQWSEMIYNELAQGRPVLYGGSSTSVGHEFVCDGYDGNGYFHFNWGWNGMSDGYFALDILNPSALGTGGGLGGGFNFDQDICIGIQPQTVANNTPLLVQTGALSASSKGTDCVISLKSDGNTGYWVNSGLQTMKVKLGLAVSPASGTGVTTYIELKNAELKAAEITNTSEGASIRWAGIPGNITTAFPKNVADGKYKVTVCSKLPDAPDSSYLPVLTGNGLYNYFYFTKNGSSYTVQNLAEASLEIAEAAMLSPLYYDTAVKFSLKVTNKSERELTQNFYPVLLSGSEVAMTANGVTLTVAPGETVTREFTSRFDLIDNGSRTGTSTYTFAWINPETDKLYSFKQTVTMDNEAPQSDIKVTEFEVSGHDFRPGKLADGTEVRLYTVASNMAIPFSCTLLNQSGYFAKEVFIAIFPQGGGQSLAMAPFPTIPTLSADQSCKLDLDLDLPQCKEENIYYAYLYTRSGNEWQEMPNLLPIFFTASKNSAVGDIILDHTDGSGISIAADHTGIISVTAADGIDGITVYSLDGNAVATRTCGGVTSAEISVSDLPAGLYIIRATASSGKSKSMKISR